MSDEHPHLWHNACKTRSEVVHLHGMSSEGNSMHSTYQEGGGWVTCPPPASRSLEAFLLAFGFFFFFGWPVARCVTDLFRDSALYGMTSKLCNVHGKCK